MAVAERDEDGRADEDGRRRTEDEQRAGAPGSAELFTRGGVDGAEREEQQRGADEEEIAHSETSGWMECGRRRRQSQWVVEFMAQAYPRGAVPPN